MTTEPDFWEVSWRMDGEAFERLQAKSIELRYKAKETVFKQGDAADSMYLVVEGYALALTSNPQTGEEQSTTIIPTGQSFGELGLLMGQPRSATVAAGTDLQVIQITIETVKALEESEPQIAVMLYKQLARTLAEQLMTQTLLLRKVLNNWW
ncbi:MAG: cyclic nucleotide-binding domain-containing protein [Anaerolineae bacterium]|nr:cyclic nucleotide-binding domain-containing protein [Anaerolineae bacterium]